MLSRWRHRAAARRARRQPVDAPRRREPQATPEVEELLRLARLSFVSLQAAWDRGDLQALSGLTTDALLEDLRGQLVLRGPTPNVTEVIALNARLLLLEDLQEAFIASVEFSGLIREQSGQSAAPFRELWLLAQLKTGGRGWELARVQSLC